MQTAQRSYLKFVDYSSFLRWDVKRYNIQQDFNFEKTYKLSEILTPYKQPVSKEEIKKNGWQIISKINFGGELFLRDFEEIETYKGNLLLVPDNAIIYSKINVRHGCIYYHDKGSAPFAVSSEYPTYKFDKTRINGFFLQKLLRSSEFKKLLNTKTSGISKARVKQEEFLDLEIPLPSLTEQEKMVFAYNKKLEEAEQLILEGKNLEGDIGRYLTTELSIESSSFSRKDTLLQFVNFSDTKRWDILFLKGDVSQLKSKYPFKKFHQIVTSFNRASDGSSIRFESYRYPNESFYYIGMEHIEKNTGKLIEMPKVLGKEIKSQTLKVPEGYLIYGKLRPYLNKYWLNNTNYENIICSSEFFVFDIDRSVNKQFFKFLLGSPIVQNQINDKTSGARMPRINEQIFMNIEIPIPPEEIQERMLKKLKDIKNRIDAKICRSEKLEQEAQQEFETAIFS